MENRQSKHKSQGHNLFHNPSWALGVLVSVRERLNVEIAYIRRLSPHTPTRNARNDDVGS